MFRANLATCFALAAWLWLAANVALAGGKGKGN